MSWQEQQDVVGEYSLRSRFLVLGLVLTLGSAFSYLGGATPESASAGLSITLSALASGMFFLRSALRVWDQVDEGEDLPYRFKVADSVLTWALVPCFVVAGLLAASTLLDAARQRSVSLFLLSVVAIPMPALAVFWWYKVRKILKEVREGAA